MSTAPKVTVLVPSYNHGRYIRQRIESILAQSYEHIELIVIDDCSSDESHEVILELRKSYNFIYLQNEKNSGTPFSSWGRIAEMATGDFLWICESDDFASPEFLATAVEKIGFSPDVVLFYCNSWVVDEDGKRVGHTNSYFHDIWKESRWDQGFISRGDNELAAYQIRGQTVPNMSSALIRTAAFRKVYDPFLEKFKLTGDWLFIGWLLLQGNVVYSPEALSCFRKHEITSRVRVKSARSQAEFLITKYLLFRKTDKPLHGFAELMQADIARFLHEPARLIDVLKALMSVSPWNAFALSATLAVSVAMAPRYFFIFCKHLLIVKRS